MHIWTDFKHSSIRTGWIATWTRTSAHYWSVPRVASVLQKQVRIGGECRRVSSRSLRSPSILQDDRRSALSRSVPGKELCWHMQLLAAFQSKWRCGRCCKEHQVWSRSVLPCSYCMALWTRTHAKSQCRGYSGTISPGRKLPSSIYREGFGDTGTIPERNLWH